MLVLINVGLVLPWTVIKVTGQIDYRWSKPIDITQPSDSDMGAFGVLLCDQYQNVHLVWSYLSDSGAAIYYRNDVGGSWSLPVDVLVMADPVAVYLDAAIANPNDTLHLVWQNAYIGGDLYYSNVSLPDADNSPAWSLPSILARNTGAGSVATDSAGTIHVVYGVVDTQAVYPAVYYIRSEDSGETWSDPVTAFSTVATFPSDIWGEVAVDDQGRIYVGVTLRSQDYGIQSEVGYVLSSDGGQTWSEYERIEATGVSFQGVAKLVPYVFGNEVHMTWHDPRRMHQWSSDGGVTWSSPVEIMPLGAAFGGPNHLVKDSAGTIHVVTAVADGVFSAAWVGKRWGPPEQIDNRYIDPHGQNMVVCQGNQLHVVYYDRTGENTIWYAYREVEAPHIDRRPFPTPVSPLAATPTATLSVPQPTVASADPLIDETRFESAEPVITEAVSDQVLPLLISVASVLVLITIVFAFRHRAGS